MRRRSVVAIAALIAAFAMVGLPAPAGSTSPSIPVAPAPAAFSDVTIPADTLAPGAQGTFGEAPGGGGRVATSTALREPGVAPSVPSSRPGVPLPATLSQEAWKAPSQVLTGLATFYDNGTTAMRL